MFSYLCSALTGLPSPISLCSAISCHTLVRILAPSRKNVVNEEVDSDLKIKQYLSRADALSIAMICSDLFLVQSEGEHLIIFFVLFLELSKCELELMELRQNPSVNSSEKKILLDQLVAIGSMMYSVYI